MRKKTPVLPDDLEDTIRAWLADLPDNKKPTINDVARFAQVSKRTVSRVINGSNLASEKTRKQVSAIVDILGFEPDTQARGLAFRHSFLIGLIYDNPNPQYVVNILEGILEALADNEFELAVHRCDRSDPHFIEKARSFVERQKLYGVILTPSASEDERLAAMIRATGSEYVRVASVALDEPHRMIVSNDRLGGVSAANYFAKLGHQRVAYISGPPTFRSSQERLAGFREGLQQANIELRTQHIFEGDYSFESGVAATERLLSLRVRPTAVFAANDEMAAGVLQAVRIRGLRVPDHLSVIGFDDFHIATSVWPRLTTIHSPTQEIGRLAATRLLARRTPSDRASHDETEPWLVIRESASEPPQE